MHKNVAELVGEIAELVRELNVTEEHRDNLFGSLSAVLAEYRSKKLSYRDYGQKTAALLRGKAREEWADYYNSYMYSLLKKIEFIIDQASQIVSDDESYLSLGAPSPSALPKPASVPAPEKKSEIFNIDNEIRKLKGLLEKGVSLPEAAAVVRKLDLDVPELSEVKAEIARAEAGSVKRAAVIAAKAEALKGQEAAAAKAGSRAAVSEKKKRRFSFRMPSLGFFGFMKLNFSPRQALQELRGARSFVAGLIGRRRGSGGGSARRAADLISFSDTLDESVSVKKSKVSREHAAGRQVKGAKKGVFSQLFGSLSQKKKEIFVDDIVSMERTARGEKPDSRLSGGEAGIAFGWFSPRRLLSEFTGRFREKQEPILGERTAVPIHMKKLREMRKKLYREERLSGFDSTLLAQEAKRIKRILEVEKQEVYQGSSLGLIANVTVRKISLFLVNNFPQFFGYLYNALRAANVRVLSNTYVNIMVLVTLMLGASVFFMLLVVFFAISYPLYQVVLRSVIFSGMAAIMCATIFYVYPFMKIRERRRKTTTNLPFAINHMSAVSSSGVPPATMFELIAESGEYEEVGVEVKKIVDLTTIFGYDLLTAIRTVAATTPSLSFKKFLEGIVSTIETGGDLVAYLREQADEAALTYKLERQRYNETVSTYSDIYTGVLIAAPLFFIAAMALVNMLGGTLGGLGVGIVMALGAYVVIPLLNIGFILFLQATQPEV